MTKFIVLLALISLRIFYGTTPVNAEITPFDSKRISLSHLVTAGIIEVNCSIKGERVFLEWTVKENENADLFEVEKSSDGKEFMTAALVFGTDEPQTEKYRFYELYSAKKMFYRIKLVNKNRAVNYSGIVTMLPKTIKSE